MYTIRGKYLNHKWEDIDEFDTKDEAEKMLKEYTLAFGAAWLLTIKKRKVLNEYEKLVRAEETCHTIEIKEKNTGKVGIANTCENGVKIFYGSDDGSDDKTVSPEIFNRDFKITAELN